MIDDDGADERQAWESEYEAWLAEVGEDEEINRLFDEAANADQR